MDPLSICDGKALSGKKFQYLFFVKLKFQIVSAFETLVSTEETFVSSVETFVSLVETFVSTANTSVSTADTSVSTANTFVSTADIFVSKLENKKGFLFLFLYKFSEVFLYKKYIVLYNIIATEIREKWSMPWL